jgi:lysyl-tRNA synthetase, class II
MLQGYLRNAIRSLSSVASASNKRISYPAYGAFDTTTNREHFRITQTIEDFRNDWNFLESGGREVESADGTPHAISLAGRVISKREASKKLYFIDIESNGSRIQVMSDERHFDENTTTGASSSPSSPISATNKDGTFDNFRSCHKELQRGDIIGVSGFPAKTNKGELSIIPKSMCWLAPCLRELPSPGDPPPQDPNVRFRQRSMDLISNQESRHILQVRFKVISLMRQYLENLNFVEAETPILNANAGGAAATPFTTSSVALGSNAPPLHLRIAPELYLKQLVIGGFDRVFEIGKVFRNEGIDSTHNPEFTTCEFYQAYAEYNDIMNLTEDMLSTLEIGIRECIKKGMIQNNPNNDNNEDDTPFIFAKKPFKRISVYDELENILNVQLPPPNELEDTKSLKILLDICNLSSNNINLEDSQATQSVPKILDHMISTLIEPLCIEPTFLCDHPSIMSPLAKNHRTRVGLTERFELFVKGKELCNAYSELNDPDVQRSRFDSQLNMRSLYNDIESHGKDEEFCESLMYGLPPTAGWGIGIDRLVMLLTNQKHIREVLPFPLLKPDERIRD